jgi:hypothetical protein
MSIKMKLEGSSVPEEFRAQMLSGKSQEQSLVISLKKRSRSPSPEFKAPVKGGRFKKDKYKLKF